jgi:hypothetical protein
MARRHVTVVLLGTLALLVALAPTAGARSPAHSSVTLHLSGSLIATGRVGSGSHPCVANRAVRIQRRGPGGGWQTVGWGRSKAQGGYRIKVADHAGTYRTFVKKRPGACRYAISRTVKHGGGGGGTNNCTPGYSPCLVWHGGADYDCYGGGGNGPYYTAPGVTYRVTGSDPYGLDADNDGYGCE